MRKSGKPHPKDRRKRTEGPPKRVAPRSSPGQKGNAVQLEAGPQKSLGKPRFGLSARQQQSLRFIWWAVRWTLHPDAIDPLDLQLLFIMLWTDSLIRSIPIREEKSKKPQRRHEKKDK